MPPEPTNAGEGCVAIVAARNEADAIGATLDALAGALPAAELVVADDASEDGTAKVAREHGARVVSGERVRGKGGNVEAVLAPLDAPSIILFCDADLGDSAGELAALVRAVEAGECELAVAAFSSRVGGGFGIALRYARWAIRRRCGYEAGAPISGQRALAGSFLESVRPLAPGFGMEIGMTVDAVRAGARVREYELDLAHRATFRTLRGFAHRARQLRDFTRAYATRR